MLSYEADVFSLLKDRERIVFGLEMMWRICVAEGGGYNKAVMNMVAVDW
jgi:hypothetical protein